MFGYWFRNRYSKFHAPGGRHWRKQTVPCTRKYKASTRYYRYPRTLQEIRYNILAHDEEAKLLKIKRPRRRKKLPTTRDDIVLSFNDKSWKVYRKHQWKDK